MKEMFLDLAKYRVQRAFETKADAAILLKSDKLAEAVNRIYYANFYAVKGLLATKMQDSSKHQIVLQTFHSSFVQAGQVPREFGLIIERSNCSRDEGGSHQEHRKPVSRAEADSLIAECEKFLCFAKDFLKTLAANDPGTSGEKALVDKESGMKS
ncbi:MAG: HEPN domain-containing protein [Gemmatimonadota bacterium]|nr:HEPN domain-containing protein [Gemmatimonadota bacterium]